ncbi:hypothetical protein [Pseudoxanthomonas wuyuanensis]
MTSEKPIALITGVAGNAGQSQAWAPCAAVRAWQMRTRLTVAVVALAEVALIALSIRRGPARQQYGGWNRWLV